MKWCSIDANGSLLQCGECPDGTPPEAFSHIPEDKVFYIPSEVSIGSHYTRNGNFFAYPEKPSSNHIWDWNSLSWKISLPLAEIAIRAKRDLMLTKSDWTQLPDVPLATKDIWVSYRQALRDITQQPGFPLEVIWPIPPQ